MSSAAKPSNSSEQALDGEILKNKDSVAFRQTRYNNQQNRIALRIGSRNVGLKNWSRTGVGFEVQDLGPVFDVGQILDDVILHCGDVILFSGRAKVKVRREGADRQQYYGVECISGLIPLEGFETAVSIDDCVSTIRSARDEFESLNLNFCRIVISLASSLRTVQRTCEQEDRRWQTLPFDRKNEAEQIFMTNMSKAIRDLFVKFNIEISSHVDVETLPDNSPYHKIFHELIYPFFEGADLARRAHDKPRGYAGDYEMMNQIYRQGFEGRDLFGKVLHNYITNENSGYSVRFRRDYFYGYFLKCLERSEIVEVLSIACGPAVEVQKAIGIWDQETLDRVRFTLFDLDREALEHAQTKIFDIAIERDRKVDVEFVNASVKAFLSVSATSDRRFDLIYSGGLFDYLDNPTCTALVRRFYSILKPGGRIVVGNFTRDNLTKAYLHLLGKWSLIHKTEGEVKAWADGISDCTIDVEYDDNKMNAFLVVRRNEHT